MEIAFHAHHAVITERMRQRAERLVRRLALLLHRIVDVTVRFVGDGPQRRVELIFHAAGGKRLVAEGRGKHFGPALSQAGSRLRAQLDHAKGIRKGRVQKNRANKGRPLEEADSDLPLAS
jgi:ribosome-associated translation inhibitor RaiA